MKQQRNEQRQADPIIAAQMEEASEAARKGEERWFICPENRPGGLKLGIGTYNPGSCRIADLFYFGKPSELIMSNAYLIVEAVNACFRINPDNPRAAAWGYGELVRACLNVRRLEMSDARHDPAVVKVIQVVSQALDQARGDA